MIPYDSIIDRSAELPLPPPKRVAPARSEPLAGLADEIILKIFENLSIKDLLNVRAVSFHSNAMFQETVINFLNKRRLSIDEVGPVIVQNFGLKERLRVIKSNDMESIKLLEHFPNIERLDIEQGDVEKPIATQYLLLGKNIRKLRLIVKNKTFDFSHMSQLAKLEKIYFVFFGKIDLNIVEFLNSFRALVQFEFCWESPSSLPVSELELFEKSSILRCVKVKDYQFSHVNRLEYSFLDLIKIELFKKITYLNLGDRRSCEDLERNVEVLCELKNLKRIMIFTKFYRFAFSTIKKILSLAPIDEILFCGNVSFSNEEIANLRETYPNLRTKYIQSWGHTPLVVNRSAI